MFRPYAITLVFALFFFLLSAQASWETVRIEDFSNVGSSPGTGGQGYTAVGGLKDIAFTATTTIPGTDVVSEVFMIPSNGAYYITIAAAAGGSTSAFVRIDNYKLERKALPQPTRVYFASESLSVPEGESVEVCVNIENPANVATTVEVALSGDGPHFPGFTPVTLTFPANSSAPQCFELTSVANNRPDTTLVYQLVLQNIMGGFNPEITMPDEMSLIIEDDLPLPEGCPWAGKDKVLCPDSADREGVLIGCPDMQIPGYRYRWVPENDLTYPHRPFTWARPLSTTTYTLYISDDNGNLIASDEVTVLVPVVASIETVGIAEGERLCGGEIVTLRALGQGSSNSDNFSYLWSNGDTTTEILFIASFNRYTHRVTITDLQSGCRSIAEYNIPLDAKPDLNPYVLGGEICELSTPAIRLNEVETLDNFDCSNTSAILLANTSYASVKFLWSTGDTTEYITVNQTGVYTIQAKFSWSNCIAKDSLSVYSCGGDVLLTFTQEDGIQYLNAGDGFSSYLWNTGATSSKIPITVSGFYEVEVVTNGGCIIKGSKYLNLNSPPEPELALDLLDSLARNIRKTIYKDMQWGLIDKRWNYNQKSKYHRDLQLSEWSEAIQELFQNLTFPGWADFPGGELELDIRLSTLAYPLKNWRLYEVVVPYSEHNTRWFRWHKYHFYDSNGTVYKKASSSGLSKMYLYPYKKWLVAVSQTGEIKKLGGFFFSEDCIDDFKLSIRRPRSFLPYLNIKYYEYFDSLWYVCRQRDTAFFEAKRGELLYTLAWDMRNRTGKEKVVSGRGGLPSYSSSYLARQEISAMPPIFFQNTQEKEAYLKDMLMRNLYLYRIYQQQGLFKPGEFDEDGLMRSPHPYTSSEIDQALPDYDEKIGHIAMYRFPACPDRYVQMDQRIYSRMDVVPSYDTLGRNPFMVSGYSAVNGYKLYALLKTRDEVLVRALEGSPDSLLWRTDDFYFPDKELAQPPPQLSMYTYWQWGDCPGTQHGTYVQRLTHKLDRLPPVALYWVALDENSKEVFFISGEDIFLSPAVRLYLRRETRYVTHLDRSRTNMRQPIFDFKEGFSLKLQYIADRLFQYGVFEILKSEVVQENWAKTVVETQSHYPIKGRRLRATFYEDRPETIEVEWLDN